MDIRARWHQISYRRHMSSHGLKSYFLTLGNCVNYQNLSVLISRDGRALSTLECSLCRESSVLLDRNSNSNHCVHHNISERIKILWLFPVLFHWMYENAMTCTWSLSTFSLKIWNIRILGLSFPMRIIVLSFFKNDFPIQGDLFS